MADNEWLAYKKRNKIHCKRGILISDAIWVKLLVLKIQSK